MGRANLKDINSPKGSAEVGYRIDHRVRGQGLATLALKHLIHEAQAHWNPTQLIVYVYEVNIGSSEVLSRCRFLSEPQSREDSTDECRFVLSI
ncbi:hypothetical protein D3C81_1730710 [compost metagenome]